jgi:hypothetical protein
MFEIDIIKLVESIVDVKFYPINVPSSVDDNGAGVYRVTSDQRYTQGAYGDFTVRDRGLRLTLINESFNTLIVNSNLLISALDGYAGDEGNTKFIGIRVDNTTDLFSSTQNLYERSIDLSIISINNQ